MPSLLLPRTLSAYVALRSTPAGGGGLPGNLTGDPYSFLNPMLDNTGGSSEVYHVTNLDESGPGSFQAAITNRTPGVARIVVFDVSGVCDIQGVNLYVDEPNLFVAGETAPDPGDGSGRGFHVRGVAIRVRTSRVVFRHITCQPKIGWYNAGEKDQEGIYWYNDNSGGEHRGFVCQNVSFHGSTDEALAPKNYENTSPDDPPDSQITGGLGYFDCHIAAALNRNQTLVDRDGQDPGSLDHKNGHNYGPMVGYGTFGVAFVRNLMMGSVRRAPQFGGSTDGIVQNNVIFGHGRANGGWTAVPFIVDARPGDGTDRYSPHTRCKVGYMSNYIEAGPFSDPWDVGGHITMNNSQYQTDTLWDIYMDDGHRHLSYFPESGMSGFSSQSLADINTAGPQGAIQKEWEPVPQPDAANVGSFLPEPPYAPPASILSANDSVTAVKQHAGAWPAQRHALDQWYQDRFTAKDYMVYGRVQEQTQITPRTGVAPAVPSNPWSLEANGLTKMENWLNDLHVAAGGYPDYSAAKWFAQA